MYNFSDKSILVTGSTRGIGRAIAEFLFSHGATVGIHGRNLDTVEKACSEISSNGTRTVPVAHNLSEPEAGAAVVHTFYESTGRLDGMVNNAGAGKALAFRGMTLSKWKNTFNTNLEAAMTATKEAYTIMRKQGFGSIVNIASLSAHGPGKWMGADYAASKAGLVSLTRSLAFEAARFGIRANAVSPGIIETDMTSMLSEETKKTLNIPMGRLGYTEEIASVAAFLLSDNSAYITGQILHVDGGLWMKG
ncbi:SDR family NAD(P)-dependent oxidoreductase [Verrucomicrobiota bacterium]